MKSRYPVALSLSVLAFVLALAGCGTTSSNKAEKPTIEFTSSALAYGLQIANHYRCDPRVDWLPLKWGELPARTRELVLYIVRYGTPKSVKNGRIKVPVEGEAIVAGLKPTLRGLTPGRFPAGTRIAIHRAANGEPISICPPSGQRTNILYRIYALPHALQLSEHANLINLLNTQAIAAGTFSFSYRSA